MGERLVGYLVAQIGQRPRNPVIAPVPVLAGHPNDQLLDLSLDPGSAWASTRRAIELAGDKLPIPSQDGVGPGYGRDVGKKLAAQAMTDLAEHASLGVRQLQSAYPLRLQDAVLGGQIFIPREKLLVHCPRHVGQHTPPIHTPPCPTPALADYIIPFPQNSPYPPPLLLPTPPHSPHSRPLS